jgi:beta-carotene 3-hydroxylase
MSLVYWILIILAAFTMMEAITWLTHKYVMHSLLWYLHEDHHNPRGHSFQKNDAFFLIFAIPGWLSIMLGLQYNVYWVAAVGIGITLYGAAYFIVHDIIIHQRFKWFTKTNSRYLQALRWAHKMHHKHIDKHNGESFGLLFVAKQYWRKIKRDKALQQASAV